MYEMDSWFFVSWLNFGFWHFNTISKYKATVLRNIWVQIDWFQILFLISPIYEWLAWHYLCLFLYFIVHTMNGLVPARIFQQSIRSNWNFVHVISNGVYEKGNQTVLQLTVLKNGFCDSKVNFSNYFFKYQKCKLRFTRE